MMRILRASGRTLSTGSILLAGLVLSACGGGTGGNSAAVSTDRNSISKIGDGQQPFTAYGDNAAAKQEPADSPKGKAFLAKIVRENAPKLAASTAPKPRDQSMVLGFPVSLLGQNYVFGAVITGVSDKTNQNLGQLKLTDLTSLNTQPAVMQTTDGKYKFALIGCINKCREGSELSVLISTDVVGVNVEQNQILVDLAPLGDKLNLIEMLDPTGSFTQLKTKKSSVTRFEYSLTTLVFDIEVTMGPIDADGDESADADVPTPTVPDTVFTTRWYLKLQSGFNQAYVSRPATDGVGFFMTERNAKPLVQRWSIQSDFRGRSDSQTTVHYYVKHVPKEYQGAFAVSFDDWNRKFQSIVGRKLFSYEFLAEEDPRNDSIVTGDPRYNVVEWDLKNIAPYGGLGPSFANQQTGEIFGANVLIQGPTIVQLYSQWFNVSKKAAAMRERGDILDAEALLLQTQRALKAKLSARQANATRVALNLDGLLEFRVPAQLPELADPIALRMDFDAVPAGFTYEQYMAGYFRDMVSHELGHNVGLRHNFRGNLGATGALKQGEVSISVMEYLNQMFRQYDQIGPYDQMAVAYGYLGKKPTITTQYCTDEDGVNPQNPYASAECSSDDATPDPFGYFSGRLDQAIDKLVGSTTDAPTWAISDMDGQLTTAFQGLKQYASSAEKTAAGWTNFFKQPGRPTKAEDVKAFVLAQLQGKICAKALDDAAAAKATDDGKKAAKANLDALRARLVKELTTPGLFTADQAQCKAAAE